MKLQDLKREIKTHSSKARKKTNEWFFKTGKGEYGEGDKFLGLNMGDVRTIAKKHWEISLPSVKKLLESPFHEERMVALLILVQKYEKGDEKTKKTIFNFYIKNRKGINNWDLVDVTTPNIVGDYLKTRNRKLLYKFAHSKNLWEKRIAVLATFPFIKTGDFEDIFQISEILFSRNKHDLIHKATGWMLREVGKQDQTRLEVFLKKHIKTIPRTTLRYAIERFEEKKRKKYLKL